MDAPISIEGLSKQFGSLLAVDNVSIRVAPGEVVGLLGPNGAGKTTTLRMLAGLITPSAGNARICGIDVSQDPIAARRQLGFLTATTKLYDRLSPRELLRTFGELYGLSEADLRGRIDALTQQLDLGAFLDQRCGTLSSGQLQRVSIARATVHDPAVYVLDEPTSTLDPLASESILALVKDASRRGRAVLFSTHRMDEAEYVCQRICFLRKGKLVAEGSPRELRERSGQTTLHGAFLHFAEGQSALTAASRSTGGVA